jgi:MerR family redox-sensitive transcriptional activator SoxR
MGEWTIGELARQASLRPSALRYYEDVGILPLARRVSGQRRYDDAALRRLVAIRVAQQAGFTLAEIRLLVHGFSPRTAPSARWRELARRKLPEVEGLIARARGMKRMLEAGLRCECVSLDDCVLVAQRLGTGAPQRRPAHAARGARRGLR